MLREMYPDKGTFLSSRINIQYVGMLISLIWIQDMNFQGSTCICRVPKGQVKKGTVVECVHCGTYEFLWCAAGLES